MKNQKPLVLLALNEINFDIAQQYVDQLDLRGFAKILDGDLRRTSSEAEYGQLEPWIQWVSAQTGQTAQEHGIFRLGDIVNRGVAQIFEVLEAKGKRVGAVSPMNAENRLSRPSYFIPDPWTDTPSDNTFWSKHLAKAISQAVSDNSAGHITVANAVILMLGILRFARFRNYKLYLSLAWRSKGAPWRKALFLDMFLNDLHCRLRGRHKPDFSMLFLNAGAHIQHHYMLNSQAVESQGPANPDWYVAVDEDPMAEMLVVYDRILCDYLFDGDINLIMATGLRQVPCPRATFYYRLRDHRAFLQSLGIEPAALLPRMTRDFLVEFNTETEASQAEQILCSLTSSVDGVRLFEEIDNRGQSLFVTLTYPNEIVGETRVVGGAQSLPLKDQTVFVAIKNGMHDGQGYIYCHGEVARFAPVDGEHVKAVYSAVINFFDHPRMV